MITSFDNKKIAAVKRLNDKKYRREEEKYLVEGEKLLDDALRFGKKVAAILVTEGKEEKYQSFPNVITVSQSVMKSISKTACDQGVLGVLEIEQNNNDAFDGNCLILERIQDPLNLGAILRSAAGAGYKEVFLADCADVYSQKVVRGAMSAHFMLNFYFLSIEEALAKLSKTHAMLCADMKGDNIFEFAAPYPHALVIGSEGQGLSSYAKKACKQKLSIPMGEGLESLNAAVSASIIMYQLTRGKR